MTTVSISANNFAKDAHSPSSAKTSMVGISWSQLITRVHAAWADRKAGYREGVVLVPIQVNDGEFTCPVVTLNSDDLIVTRFVGRRDGETARKLTSVSKIDKSGNARHPSSATHVDVVLYSHDTLGEEATTDADWEIITLLGKLSEVDQPMTPATLMANHFGIDGGTETHMSPAEFEAALKASYLYWWDKGILG